MAEKRYDHYWLRKAGAGPPLANIGPLDVYYMRDSSHKGFVLVIVEKTAKYFYMQDEKAARRACGAYADAVRMAVTLKEGL